MANNNIQKLLKKNMNRKEFLAHVGAGVLVVTGLSGIMKYLLDFNSGNKSNTTTSTVGYGSGSYGGKQDGS